MRSAVLPTLLLLTLGSLSGCDIEIATWHAEYLDGSPIQEEPEKVGVHTSASLLLSAGWLVPKNLVILPDDPNTVRVTVGRSVFRMSEGSVEYDPPNGFENALEVFIEPLQPGSNRIRFLADNVGEVLKIPFESVEVTSTVVRSRDSVPKEGRLTAFTNALVPVAVDVYSGAEKLRGDVTLALEQPDGFASELREGILFLDDRAHHLRLSAPLPDAHLDVDVVTTENVSDILVRDIWGDLPTIAVNHTLRLQIEPLDARGEIIAGAERAPFQTELVPPSVGNLLPGITSLQFMSSEVGESTIRFFWGSTERRISVSVVGE
ncbi:MAG TPA: hypothetical protein VFQ61_04080 [Polyangiaceae bacterium]|nr:hypothetical protein [Polyangiaceae bacterium]